MRDTSVPTRYSEESDRSLELCNHNTGFIFVHRFKGNLPKLQPITDMGIQDPSLEKLLGREKELQARVGILPFHRDEDREQQLQRYRIIGSSSVSLYVH